MLNEMDANDRVLAAIDDEAIADSQQAANKEGFWAWRKPYQLPDGWIARVDLVAWHAWLAATIAARAPADSVTAPAKTRQIAECYGDCPTDPKTCANPCKFEGRAARAPADSVTAPAAGAVAGPTRQQVSDRFGFLEGLVAEHTYTRIVDEVVAMLAAAPTPAAQQGAGSIDGQPVLPEASPATKGQCNSERACGACFSGQGSCEVSTTAPPPTVQGLDANDTKRMDWLCDPDSVYWIEINAEPDRREVFSSSQVWRLRAVIDAALAQKEDKE